MTIFEFLSVAASIVMALSLGTLVSSIPYVFHPKRFDWLHAAYFILLFATLILVWWNVWLLNTVDDWNIVSFAILMGSPISLYLAVYALVSDHPRDVESWRSYFEQNSRWVFLAAIAIMLFGILRAYYLLDSAPTWHGIVLTLCLFLGTIFASRIVHIVLLAAVLAFLIVGITRWFDADRQVAAAGRENIGTILPLGSTSVYQ